MWYCTEKEAKDACEWKEKKYGYKFHVLKEDTEICGKKTEIYWAQRVSATRDT